MSVQSNVSSLPVEGATLVSFRPPHSHNEFISFCLHNNGGEPLCDANCLLPLRGAGRCVAFGDRGQFSPDLIRQDPYNVNDNGIDRKPF